MSHSHQDIFENRKQFQLERMILFSDAVFAIVITLLVIEIKVPEVAVTGMLPVEELKKDLVRLLPQIAGFVMSFFVIGLFWINHHRVFGYVINYDIRLLWLNLFMLLAVAFLPFTTSLVSQHGYLNLAYIIYSCNLGMIGLMSFFVWKHISNPVKKLSVGLEDINMRRYGRTRSLTVACIFFSGALFCLFNSDVFFWIDRFIFILIFPALRIIKRIYKIKGDA